MSEKLSSHNRIQCFFFLTRFVAKLFFEGPPPPLPPELIQIFKYKNADWDKYRREIMRTVTRTTPANTPDEIDAQINTFTNTMHSARDIVFKPTTIPKNRTPLPTRIVKLIKEKRKLYREFIQTRDPLLKTLFNKLNAQIRRDINRYREETWIKTCESLDYRDGKKFWNKFKVITGQKRKTNHYLATDAHIYYTPQERANCFAEQLDGIHQVPNDPNFNATFFDQIANNVHAFKNIPLIDPLPHPLHNEHLTDNITTDEVKTIMTKSWPVTAPGSQGVFRGRGRGFGFFKNGRQAAIVLSWLLLVQLPGQVLRSYSSKVSKSKRFLIVKQILVYSVTAKLSTEQHLVVRYWFTRMRLWFACNY
jgi:hypothetical protein